MKRGIKERVAGPIRAKYSWLKYSTWLKYLTTTFVKVTFNEGAAQVE